MIDFHMVWLKAPYNRLGFYVQYVGAQGIIDVLGRSTKPFKMVEDLDAILSFA